MIARKPGPIDGAVELLLALVLVAMIVLNFANVIGRYVFGRSIFGADEIQLFALVVVAYLGAIVVTWRGEHLKMDVVARMFPSSARWAFRVVESLVFAAICGVVATYSFDYTSRMRSLGRMSDMAGIPVWYVHAVVTLAMAAMAGIALVNLVRALRSPAPEREPQPAVPVEATDPIAREVAAP